MTPSPFSLSCLIFLVPRSRLLKQYGSNTAIFALIIEVMNYFLNSDLRRRTNHFRAFLPTSLSRCRHPEGNFWCLGRHPARGLWRQRRGQRPPRRRRHRPPTRPRPPPPPREPRTAPCCRTLGLKPGRRRQGTSGRFNRIFYQFSAVSGLSLA